MWSSRVAGIRMSACACAEQPGIAQLAEGPDRVRVEHLGVGRRVHELQVLGDELEVDEAAAHLLQVPDVVGALLLGDALAHVAHVGGDLGAVARQDERGADGLARRARAAPPARR